MKTFLVLALLQLLYVEKSIQKANEEVLKVSIFYESMCRYSVDFITEQFYPGYQKIKSSLQVDFVPYGNAKHKKVNGTWKFDCQHGEDECWGNKAQACGLAAQKGQDESVEYINCIMGHDDPVSEDAVHQCAPKLGVSANSILECAGGPEGDELHAKFGDQTNATEAVAETGVPLVMFNDKYDEKLDADAVSEFLRTCCSLLPSNTEGCPTEDNKLIEE